METRCRNEKNNTDLAENETDRLFSELKKYFRLAVKGHSNCMNDI